MLSRFINQTAVAGSSTDFQFRSIGVSTSTLNKFTISGVDIGPEDTNRVIVVGVSYGKQSSTATSPLVHISGTATSDYFASSQANVTNSAGGVWFGYKYIATGVTADFDITIWKSGGTPTSDGCVIAIWSGLLPSSDGSTDPRDDSSSSTVGSDTVGSAFGMTLNGLVLSTNMNSNSLATVAPTWNGSESLHAVASGTCASATPFNYWFYDLTPSETVVGANFPAVTRTITWNSNKVSTERSSILSVI